MIIGPSSFSSPGNLETIARQTAIVGTAALGMTMVIIAGGIDLSVGSVIALVTVLIASAMQAGFSPIVAVLTGVLGGTLCGMVNGLLITRLRVVPFIVTLGTLLVVRGAAKGFAHEQKIDAPMTWLNDLLASLPPDRAWQLVPPGVWVLVLLAAGVAALLRYTRPRPPYVRRRIERTDGPPVRRAGGEGEAAGLWLERDVSGLAGVMQFSRLTVGDPTVAVGTELDVIAAVVIGGGSFSGGEGSVLGTMVGALIMTVIRSGCSQMGLPNWVQEIVTGAIIVLAVAVDRLRHRRMA